MLGCRRLFQVALALGVGVAGPLMAQDGTTDLQQEETGSTVTPNIDDTEGPDNVAGYAAGGFRLFPEVSFTALYDSNIYGVNGSVPMDKAEPRGEIEDETSDIVRIASPGLAVQSDWERHELTLNAGADLARFQDNNDENYDDFWINTAGRYDIGSASNLFGGLGIGRSHEDRSSPEGSVGIKPVRYRTADAHGGYAQRIGRTVLRLGGTAQRLDYEDGLTSDGQLINHEDRDRDIYSFGTRLTYLLSGQLRPFVQGSVERRRYDRLTSPLQVTGVPAEELDRDSEGYRAALGLAFDQGRNLSGEVYGGVLHQGFDDPRFKSITKPDFGARLGWQATPYTRLTGSVDRSLEETTYWETQESGPPVFASSYLYSRAQVQAEHQLTPRTTLSALVSFGQVDYKGVDRKDDLIGTGVEIEYKLTKNLLVQLDYRHYQRDSDYRDPFNEQDGQSNGDLFDGNYQRDQLSLSLKTLLYPVGEGQLSDGTYSGLSGKRTASGFWDGFYVGAHTGGSGMATDTTGPRGEQGTDTSTMVGSGWSSGLFAGWGMLSDHHWYGGVEIETAHSSADWDHTKNKSTSRTFSLDMDDSRGLSLRGGRELANGVLVYGRLGVVRTEFDTFYQVNDAPENAADQSDDRRGLRLGLGFDVMAGRYWFWRTEYSYTDYDGYEVVYDTTPGSVDRFSTQEGLYRIGLGRRLAQAEGTPLDPTNGDIGGFYAGGQVGQTFLQTDMTATHYDAGTGPYRLHSTFGDKGVSKGFFAGYGWQWDALYLGLELGVENSDVDWSHEREPTGRDFSFEQKGGQVLSARLGYQMDNGTLMYARFGRARSDFNYRYRKGDNELNDINRDVNEVGTRLGMGVDVPLSPKTFLRLDYNRTDYGDIRFMTTHSNSDEVRLDNETDQVRLGLGYHF